MASSALQTFVILLMSAYIFCMPEQGVWVVTYDDKSTIHAFPKSIYAKTKISVTVDCGSNQQEVDLHIQYLLRESPCAQEYEGIENIPERMNLYLNHPTVQYNENYDYNKVAFLSNRTVQKCGGDVTHIYLDFNDQNPKTEKMVVFHTDVQTTKSGNKTFVIAKQEQVEKKTKIKRAAELGKTTKQTTQKPTLKAVKTSPPKKTTPSTTTTTTTAAASKSSDSDSIVATAWKDGCYVFILELTPTPTLGNAEADKKKEKYKAVATVRMKGIHGYISAVDFPLEVFYGVMGLVYIGYGIVWIIVLACHWKDLLRVQFWIGGVIVLGMLEKAVFFAEYKNIAETGKSVRGAIILAELVSCMKRTLARMLVIVVSLGFGIVKPRLGQTFHKVLCVGVAFFVLSSIEGCMRGVRSKSDQSNELILATVPLAVIDAVIVWWIFTSLVQTTRTLRLRRNIVKLSLYRHFTNTLIFAVLASIAFMIWSITQHKLKFCTKDWKELWVDEAFWHLLFSVILLIIMILWRPDANNQRYAFSPLLDAAEDEVDEDQLMNDAFDGMKMRGVKGQANGSPRQKEKSKPDDDLKWVEENIPTSVADKALPSLLDSDEELMNTKFEMSKME